ncbi:hypothetical protein J6590_067435 [Homalodisca vitripennis]|nr:hypothetical protein J6590_067435 [Homalodisca vitripennis]
MFKLSLYFSSQCLSHRSPPSLFLSQLAVSLIPSLASSFTPSPLIHPPPLISTTERVIRAFKASSSTQVALGVDTNERKDNQTTTVGSILLVIVFSESGYNDRRDNQTTTVGSILIVIVVSDSGY